MIEALIDWNLRRKDPKRDLSDSAVLKVIDSKEAELDRLIDSHAGGSIAAMGPALELSRLYRSAERRDILPAGYSSTPEYQRRQEAMNFHGKNVGSMAKLKGRRKDRRRGSNDSDNWGDIIGDFIGGILD